MFKLALILTTFALASVACGTDPVAPANDPTVPDPTMTPVLPTVTPTPTWTPEPTATPTPSPTPSPTSTPSPTATPYPTATTTPTATPTTLPSSTPVPPTVEIVGGPDLYFSKPFGPNEGGFADVRGEVWNSGLVSVECVTISLIVHEEAGSWTFLRVGDTLYNLLAGEVRPFEVSVPVPGNVASVTFRSLEITLEC